MKDYVSPKIAVQQTNIGLGSVLLEPAAKDELLIDFRDHGVRMSESKAWRHESRGNLFVVQVDDNIHQVTLSDPKGIDFINHSCHSNCGMRGSFQVVARCPIKQGEELTLDYALADMHPWWSLECLCGHERCREFVTGKDWRKPSLQREYAGYFSDHIQRRIDMSPVQAFVRDSKESTYLAIKSVLILPLRLRDRLGKLF